MADDRAIVFGQWLTEQRLKRGRREGRTVSMQEIAESAGISRQYLGFLESGRNPSTGKGIFPAYPVVKQLARALGAPIEEALEAAGYDGVSDPRLAEITRMLRRLDDNHLETIRRVVEPMLPTEEDTSSKRERRPGTRGDDDEGGAFPHQTTVRSLAQPANENLSRRPTGRRLAAAAS